MDPESVARIPDSVSVKRVECGSMWNHSTYWRNAKAGLPRVISKAKRALANATQSFVPVDDFYPWIKPATRAGIDLVRREEVDLIWATTPPISALAVANRIGNETLTPFVLDFRDVAMRVSAEVTRRTRRAVQAESDAVGRAAGITYVSPTQLALLGQRHNLTDRTPTALIYNWFSAFDEVGEESEQFHGRTILHGGILYGGTRRLDGFAAALKILNSRDADKATRFLHLGDQENDRQYLGRLTDIHSLGNALQVGERVGHREFVAKCRGASVLLLAVGHDHGGVYHAGAIPAKLYTYFSAHRPILVVGPADCEAGRIVQETNRGLAVADDDPQQIARAIGLLCNAQGETGALDLSLDAVSDYEAKKASQRLSTFLEKILASRQRDSTA